MSEDYIGDDNPTRAIDAFVNGLDLNIAGFLRTSPGVTGRPRYNPSDLLKLYVYGYFNRIHSSRKLMTEAAEAQSSGRLTARARHIMQRFWRKSRIDENIAEYLSQMDKNDKAEPDPLYSALAAFIVYFLPCCY